MLRAECSLRSLAKPVPRLVGGGGYLSKLHPKITESTEPRDIRAQKIREELGASRIEPATSGTQRQNG